MLIYRLAMMMPPRNMLQLKAFQVRQGTQGCADIKQGMAELL